MVAVAAVVAVVVVAAVVVSMEDCTYIHPYTRPHTYARVAFSIIMAMPAARRDDVTLEFTSLPLSIEGLCMRT